MAVSESIQKLHTQIKKNIEMSYSSNQDNVKRYHEFRRYVYKSSVTENQKQALSQMGKPMVEFNIQPAYIARLLGEFAKHEPSIEVTPSEGIPVPYPVIALTEGHLRHIIYEANKNSFSDKTMQDCLTGGFSVFKVYTDYASPMSFKQIIKWDRCFDPAMCGFDPMSRTSHKGDGNYSFEIYPVTEEDFKLRYPDKDLSKLKYSRSFDKNGNIGGFNWSYKDATNNKIVLCAEYFAKKKKKTKIVELATGQVMTLKKYEDKKADWDNPENPDRINQIPVVLGEPRWTELETICRYVLTEDGIIEYEETDYKYLPHVKMVGSAIELTESNTNCVYEMTLPYVYHSRGAQEFKNFAGQSWANYLENMVQSQFLIKKEAFPQEQEYVDDLTNPQQASVLVVNAFNENNPDQPIPEPFREIATPPAPPEMMAAFQAADVVTQTILGSFASNLGRNDKDLSGKAVIETASIENAAAMPFVMGYLAAIKQASLITVDLMPKYILGKREIPVVNIKGEKGYQKINQNGAPELDYEEGALHVDIQPGVSFQVQKNQALEQIASIMQVSPVLAEFFSSEEGLPILCKNLTLHGSDELQEVIPIWMEKRKQQQAQMQQQQMMMMQNDPRMISAQASAKRADADVMKVQTDAEDKQFNRNIKVAELAIEKEKVDNDALIAQHNATLEEEHMMIARTREETSLANHALDAAAKIASHEHAKRMDEHDSVRKTVELHHKVRSKDADETMGDKE